jgi:RNA polymerase sigma-70 factor (ECF subfamily)
MQLPPNPADPGSGSRPAAPRQSEDVGLVRRIAARDQGALGELYDRYGGMLLALAHRVLGAPSEAEEVVQETFLQVWDKARTYDPARSSVSTWLVLLGRSRAIDRLRSRRAGERAGEALRTQSPKHASPSGPADVLFRERRERVREELAALPLVQRDVLEMAFYEGLTQTEIAERTGLPLGTVKTRTLLAMKKLRTALRAEIRDLL